MKLRYALSALILAAATAACSGPGQAEEGPIAEITGNDEGDNNPGCTVTVEGTEPGEFWDQGTENTEHPAPQALCDDAEVGQVVDFGDGGAELEYREENEDDD